MVVRCYHESAPAWRAIVEYIGMRPELVRRALDFESLAQAAHMLEAELLAKQVALFFHRREQLRYPA